MASSDDEGMEKDGDGTVEKFNLAEECRLLLKVSLPTVAVQFSTFFIFPQTASAVGRTLGSEALAGFSLAILTGNMTCLSVMVGALSATDTLMPRAFGTDGFREVGILAIRGFLVSGTMLLFPIIPLCTLVNKIFDRLGQDPIASDLASSWLRIYVLGVPFVLVFRVTQRFLAAQHIVLPMVFAGLIGCVVIHPFLLSSFVPWMGFLGSGLAIVGTQFIQTVLVFAYLRLRRVYHPETWPGISSVTLKEAVRPEPMLRFIRLSLGGVLALSEWWFWETICFVVGHMGVVPLCVHSIAYNLVPVSFMIPLGLSIGLSVRMGNVLAKSVSHARKIAITYMTLTIFLAVMCGLSLNKWQATIVGLFSTDVQVVNGCREIWGHVCVYIANMFVFGINGGILRALGMQLQMAAIICGTLWLTALPTVLYVGLWREGGVRAIWFHLPYFYMLMNVLMIYSYTRVDWHDISKAARERRASLVVEAVDNERTSLVEASYGNL